jgi:hypothetical protein
LRTAIFVIARYSRDVAAVVRARDDRAPLVGMEEGARRKVRAGIFGQRLIDARPMHIARDLAEAGVILLDALKAVIDKGCAGPPPES